MANYTDCTLSRCSRVFLTYEPSLAGNAVFLTLFAVLIPLTLGLGIKYKSSIFATTIATGLALEVLGYIGRVLLHHNPHDRSDLILFLIGTIMGPTFICCAVFLIMPRIITVYGEEFRSWRPLWYPFLFYALTAASLVLELAGGIASTVQDNLEQINTGIRMLVAGLAIQLVALAIFVGHAMLFAIALRTRHHTLDDKFAILYNSGLFKAFLFAFSFVTFLLVLRTSFRTVVIAEGYDSSIAQSEMLLLILDGLMVLLATLTLLAFFPGRILGELPSQAPVEIPVQRLSRSPLQPIRPSPYEPPSAQNSPTYSINNNNRMSVKSSMTNSSPRKLYYPAPPPQRSMVDSDALW